MAQIVRQSKKIKPGSSVTTEKVLKYLRTALFIAVLIAVFYPPYLRGLYFEDEFLPTEIFVFAAFAVFWMYKIIRKDRRFLETPIDYAAFGFVIVYFLSIFASVGLRLAVTEWLKYCMYFAVFFMLSELADTYKTRVAVLWVIVASATGVAMLGVDGAAGGHVSNALNSFFRLLGVQRDVFFGLFDSGRIHSTVQYPNALAAYLMAAFFISQALAVVSARRWAKAAAGGAGFIMLVTFVFTLSRGAYLIMPVEAVLYLVALPKGSRIEGVTYAFATIVAAGFTSLRISGYISNQTGQNALTIWEWIAAGLAASVLLTIIVSFIVRFLKKISWKVYAGAAIALVAIAVAAGIYAFSASVPLELAHSVEQENSRIDKTRSVVLEPEREYKLVYEVSAQMSADKPYAYYITIFSRDERNILSGGRTQLVSYAEKGTSGSEKREINFKVPAGSKIVDISFINYYQGTGAVFHSAKVVDAGTGKTVKNIALKYKYLPEAIVSRIEDMQASYSALTRNMFYKDGLAILKDHWLLGAGGGAWSLLYFSYQSYLYWSNQAHNYPLQLGIETGILGLAMLLLLFLSIGYALIKEYRKKIEINRNEGILKAALVTAIAAMFIHSFIDFDFSLPAVFLLLWEFIALFNARCRLLPRDKSLIPEDGGRKEHKIGGRNKPASGLHPVIGLAVVVAIMFVPVMLTVAKAYGSSGSKAVQARKMDDAAECFRKATAWDPFSAEYKISHANILLGKKKVSQQDLAEANRQVEAAEVLARYDVRLIPEIGSYYLSIGNIEKGLEFFDRAIELRPFRPEEWQNKISAYYEVAMLYFGRKNNKTAMDYVDKALAIINEAKSTNERNLNPFVFNRSTSEMLEKLKYIKDNAEKGGKIKIDEVVFYGMPEMDINSDGVPDQWTLSAPDQVKISVKDSNITVENTLVAKLPYIQSRQLELEPGKKYSIRLELTEAYKPDAIAFMVTGVMSGPANLERIGDVYTAEITTSADSSNSKHSLLLFVNKSFEFKNVLVVEK